MSVFTDLYKKNEQAVQALSINNSIRTRKFFSSYFEALMLNSFQWDGVPKEYRPQWIEMLCYGTKLVGGFKEGDSLLILPAAPVGSLMRNGEYTDYQMFAPNGDVFFRKREDVELLYNNSLNLSTYTIIYDLLDNLNLSMDVIYSYLIKCRIGEHFDCDSEDIVNSITTAINDAIKEGRFFSASVGRSIGENINKISLFDDKGHFIEDIWNNIDKTNGIIHQEIGFVQTESVKRERLTEAEAQDNRDQAQYGLISDMLNNRTVWCDRINNHTGWSFDTISVKLMRDYHTDPEENKEESEDESDVSELE